MSYGSPDSVDDAASRLAEEINVIRNILTYKSWKFLGQLKDYTAMKLYLCDDTCTKFYTEQVLVSLEQSVVIAQQTSIQGGDEWHHERKKRITGSKAYSLFTYSSNKNPNWDRKYQQVYCSGFSGNEATIHGLRCEGPGKERYASDLGCRLFESGLYVRHEVPLMGYSADSVILDPNNKPLRLFELKSPKEGKRLLASQFILMKAVKSFDKDGKLKKKCEHYGQIQLGMFLLGLDVADYVNYASAGDDIIYERVGFDLDFVEKMTKSLCDVYFKEILPRLAHNSNNNNEH